METQVCNKCNEEKKLIDFDYVSKRKTYAGFCKVCRRLRDKAYYASKPELGRARTNKWKSNNPEHKAKIDRRHNWKTQGINPDIAEEYYQAHHGKCDICGIIPTNKSLDVDHCHTSGKIRGMLCRSCNTGLGQFKDSPEILQLAIAYLNTVR